MDFDLGRLRKGEWVAGVGALLLFLALFFVDWYGVDVLGFTVAENGWHTHSILRWLMLLTIALGLALAILTAVRDTPAVPATAAPVATAVAALTTLLLAYRVLIDEPGPNELIDVKFGAYLGLVAAALVTYGGYLSMRDESGGPHVGDIPARRLSAS